MPYSPEAQSLTDPTDRLEMYVRTTLAPLHDPAGVTAAQFITAEHWRLHQTSPAEVWDATQPMSDLIRVEIEAGSSDGTLSPRNPERDAWLMTKTIIGAYHHYTFQPDDPAMATLGDDVWLFCLAAVGGSPSSTPVPLTRPFGIDGRSPLSSPHRGGRSWCRQRPHPVRGGPTPCMVGQWTRCSDTASRSMGGSSHG